MKRILIPHTRELCYFSGSFFLDRIGEHLEKNGCLVDRLELSGGTSKGLTGGSDFAALEDCLKNTYDAVLDINSKLPYLTLDNGEPLLDCLGAPFFNYILDHPLYHHPGLSFPLKNYHVIAIDQRHAAYIRRWYPHLKNVSCLPMAGTVALSYAGSAQTEKQKEITQEYPELWERGGNGKRSIEILFSGTYLPEQIIREEMRAQGEEMYGLMQLLADRWNPAKETMEDAVLAFMEQRPDCFIRAAQELGRSSDLEREQESSFAVMEELTDERNISSPDRTNRGTDPGMSASVMPNGRKDPAMPTSVMPNGRKASAMSASVIRFPEWMNRLYPVDRLKRYEKRYRLIEAVAKRGLPLSIMGEGWEETELAYLSNVKLLPPRPMAMSFEVFADAKIVLDCNPLFFEGMHDRVPAALLNGALCLTDMNPAAAPELRNGEQLFYYAPDHPEEAVELLCKLLEPTEEQGYSRGIGKAEELGGSEITVAGEAVARANYSWEAHGKKLLSILDE